ncbi:MAG TPA: dipicolinate synthase subunit B [Sphingobacteriaceae bacterium]|nr:dipicolinate synthase subunit B [Sphingobacteriaceae bacterium]
MGALAGKRVGFAICASHHHLDQAMDWVAQVVEQGAHVYPIVSRSVLTTATRFGDGEKWAGALRRITGREPWTTIPDVEPIGPQKLCDVVLVAPCTGGTLARLANAITDSAVTMAVKAQLRNGRPVVLGITSNDILGLNARNLAVLLAARNVYFIPFGQDDPHGKPTSITARWDLMIPTLAAALAGRQLQPILQGPL